MIKYFILSHLYLQIAKTIIDFCECYQPPVVKIEDMFESYSLYGVNQRFACFVEVFLYNMLPNN